MERLRIDRLSLHVHGIGVLDGRRLAEQLGRDLAEVASPGAAPVRAERMRLQVQVGRGATTEALSRQIVDALLRALATHT